MLSVDEVESVDDVPVSALRIELSGIWTPWVAPAPPPW